MTIVRPRLRLLLLVVAFCCALGVASARSTLHVGGAAASGGVLASGGGEEGDGVAGDGGVRAAVDKAVLTLQTGKGDLAARLKRRLVKVMHESPASMAALFDELSAAVLKAGRAADADWRGASQTCHKLNSTFVGKMADYRQRIAKLQARQRKQQAALAGKRAEVSELTDLLSQAQAALVHSGLAKDAAQAHAAADLALLQLSAQTASSPSPSPTPSPAGQPGVETGSDPLQPVLQDRDPREAAAEKRAHFSPRRRTVYRLMRELGQQIKNTTGGSAPPEAASLASLLSARRALQEKELQLASQLSGAHSEVEQLSADVSLAGFNLHSYRSLMHSEHRMVAHLLAKCSQKGAQHTAGQLARTAQLSALSSLSSLMRHQPQALRRVLRRVVAVGAKPAAAATPPPPPPPPKPTGPRVIVEENHATGRKAVLRGEEAELFPEDAVAAEEYRTKKALQAEAKEKAAAARRAARARARAVREAKRREKERLKLMGAKERRIHQLKATIRKAEPRVKNARGVFYQARKRAAHSLAVAQTAAALANTTRDALSACDKDLVAAHKSFKVAQLAYNRAAGEPSVSAGALGAAAGSVKALGSRVRQMMATCRKSHAEWVKARAAAEDANEAAVAERDARDAAKRSFVDLQEEVDGARAQLEAINEEMVQRTLPHPTPSPLELQPCGLYLNCAECTADPACGWLDGLATCAAGTQAGPLLPPIGGAADDWEFHTCPLEKCGALATCGQCLRHAGCGFCGANLVCAEGDGDGPMLASRCEGAFVVSWTAAANSTTAALPAGVCPPQEKHASSLAGEQATAVQQLDRLLHRLKQTRAALARRRAAGHSDSSPSSAKLLKLQAALRKQRGGTEAAVRATERGAAQTYRAGYDVGVKHGKQEAATLNANVRRLYHQLVAAKLLASEDGKQAGAAKPAPLRELDEEEAAEAAKRAAVEQEAAVLQAERAAEAEAKRRAAEELSAAEEAVAAARAPFPINTDVGIPKEQKGLAPPAADDNGNSKQTAAVAAAEAEAKADAASVRPDPTVVADEPTSDAAKRVAKAEPAPQLPPEDLRKLKRARAAAEVKNKDAAETLEAASKTKRATASRVLAARAALENQRAELSALGDAKARLLEELHRRQREAAALTEEALLAVRGAEDRSNDSSLTMLDHMLADYQAKRAGLLATAVNEQAAERAHQLAQAKATIHSMHGEWARLEQEEKDAEEADAAASRAVAAARAASKKTHAAAEAAREALIHALARERSKIATAVQLPHRQFVPAGGATAAAFYLRLRDTPSACVAPSQDRFMNDISLQLEACDRRVPTQLWRQDSRGKLHNFFDTAFIAHVDGDTPAAGGSLSIRDCSNGCLHGKHDAWQLTADGQVVNQAADVLLAAPDSKLGSKLQLAAPDGAALTAWSFVPFKPLPGAANPFLLQSRTRRGLCAIARDGALTLDLCKPTDRDQLWLLDATGFLRRFSAPLDAVRVAGDEVSEGARLMVQRCDATVCRAGSAHALHVTRSGLLRSQADARFIVNINGAVVTQGAQLNMARCGSADVAVLADCLDAVTNQWLFLPVNRQRLDQAVLS